MGNQSGVESGDSGARSWSVDGGGGAIRGAGIDDHAGQTKLKLRRAPPKIANLKPLHISETEISFVGEIRERRARAPRRIAAERCPALNS